MMKKLIALTAALALLPLIQSKSQSVNHWETAVFNSDKWHYFVGTSEPDINWSKPSFNDAAWPEGTGGFGYSDNDDNTVIPQCNAVYLRIKFNVSDTSVLSEALLNMDYDDAFIAYLNDQEIARSGITGFHPPYNQTATDHEAALYAGGQPEYFLCSKALLKNCLLPGENFLTIEVHNTSASSSDLSSNAWLSFGIKSSAILFRHVPEWFIAPVVYDSSNLPLVFIDTDGRVDIPDAPRVMAAMKIVNRGGGQRNFLADKDSVKYLDYNGRISIEVRGSSSQAVPKKQYALTTLKDDNYSNANVILLGLPADNDWILNGLAFEPSLIRDYINYNLSRRMGQYASRTVYCEVILNGKYNGLYVLQEKIKQGSKRVDVAKISKDDNQYPGLSGGYITKADKTTGGDPVAWTMSSYLGLNDVTFIHTQPKPEDVTREQNDYIQYQFNALQNTASVHNSSLTDGYPSVIDVPSFIDFLLINEYGSNADAYQFSTYYHKERNGKLMAGPIWDLNLTFGNDLTIWGLSRSKYNNWQLDNGDNIGPKYWRDLFGDPNFRCYTAKRFNELIQPGMPLNYEVVSAMIDSTVTLISEAAGREMKQWGTFSSLANETGNIKSFIYSRIPWMTSQLGGFDRCSNVTIPSLVITKIMYDPKVSFDFPDGNSQEFIEITNTGTENADLTGLYFAGTGFIYQFPPNSSLAAGKSLYLASDARVFRQKYSASPFGQYYKNLAGDGEDLTLIDAFGNIVDKVDYRTTTPWPDARGNGMYIELIDNASDNNDGANWRAALNLDVSSNEAEAGNIFKAYPSPVTDKLVVETSGAACKASLTDLQGRTILTKESSDDFFFIDMTACKPGIYILTVEIQGRSYTRKIVKV